MKEYFTVEETAACLSTPEQPLGRRDILDLAMRGKLRLAFWFDGDLRRFRCVIGGGYADPRDDDAEAWHVSTAGYFLIPGWQVTPKANTFVVDDMRPIEKPAWASRVWRMGTQGYVLGAYSWEIDGRIAHRPIVVDPDSVLVPRSDVEALTKTAPAGTAKHNRARYSADTNSNSDPEDLIENAPDLNGLVAWQRALLECWTQIADAHKGQPTPRDAMVWLKKNGSRDVISDFQPDSETMRWIGLDGTVHTVALKTIQTRVSEWKKTGKLPA